MTIKKLLKIWLLLVWPAAIVAGAGVPVAPSLFEKSSPRRDFERPGSRNRKVSFGTVAGVEVRLGVLDDGGPTAEWLAAIKDRMAAEDFEKIKKSRKPLSEAERKWLELAEVVAGEWAARRARLQIPFGRTKAPARLVILAGNQGGDDGFTFRDNIICLELAALAANYGDAGTPENRERLVRTLDHEYTHLLHHAWFERRPPDLSTPFARALRDCLAEGIGNYRSLSARWRDPSGAFTPHAEATLKELMPVFVERLAKLQTAREGAEETALRENLSRGRFDRKWGALTVALWLARETKGDDRKLSKWIKRGPRGVVKLARKHLPAELKAKFLK